MRLNQMRCVLFMLGMGTTLFLAGCGQSGNTLPSPDGHEGHDHGPGEGHEGHDHGPGEGHEGEEQASHDHGGWWCPEHGIPEEVCTRCDSSLIAGFKEKNDWCDEHDRPDSQCFHCHPDLETKFAARFEAKFGKKPPKPTDP